MTIVLASLVGWAVRSEEHVAWRSDTELAQRAGEILNQAGVAKPDYSAGGFMDNSIYFERVAQRDPNAMAYHSAHPQASAGILYWRRWSSRVLIHPDMHNPSPNLFEPTPGPGSVMVLMDPAGRLVHLSTVPAASGQSGTLDRAVSRVADWPGFVNAAGTTRPG